MKKTFSGLTKGSNQRERGVASSSFVAPTGRRRAVARGNRNQPIARAMK